MSRVPIADARVRVFVAMLAMSFYGHALQLYEDTPWREIAMRRFWATPGWHLFLPVWAPIVIGVALAIAGLIAAITRNRVALVVTLALYLAHYLTYPWRIRNHMTTMLMGIGVVSLVWLAARASGALVPGNARSRQVDRVASTGLAAVIVVQYFFAGLHKTNAIFLDPSVGGPSPAMAGVQFLWMFGSLGDHPPGWIGWIATYGSVAIETMVPVIAWRVRRLTLPAIVVMLAFHVPHVTSMGVADYPLMASTFYPSLMSRGQWRIVSRNLRPSRWTISFAVIGAAVQLWFMPWWNHMNTYGLVVLALWGFVAGAIVQAIARSALARSARR